MNKALRVCLAILTMFLTAIGASPQHVVASDESNDATPNIENRVVALDRDASREAVDSISQQWGEWEKLSISGKLRMSGLPVTPSIKIYMEKDSLILISLRAPFVGEVGRLEIADSCILVVNKMNGTYMQESLEKALTFYPGGVRDVQELLLGHIVIPGCGLLRAECLDMVQLYAPADSTIQIVASEKGQIPGFSYGYSYDTGDRTMALIVLSQDKPDVEVTLLKTLTEKGYNLDMNYLSPERGYNALIELNEPDIDAKGFDRITLGRKYKQVSPQQFLKSF